MWESSIYTKAAARAIVGFVRQVEKKKTTKRLKLITIST
jgi:hypothetical protein